MQVTATADQPDPSASNLQLTIKMNALKTQLKTLVRCLDTQDSAPTSSISSDSG